MVTINNSVVVVDGNAVDKVYSGEIPVYSRNYILESNVSTNEQLTDFDLSMPVSELSNKKIILSVQIDYEKITNAGGGVGMIGCEFGVYNVTNDNDYEPILLDVLQRPSIGDSFHGRAYLEYDFTNIKVAGISGGNHFDGGLLINALAGSNISVSNPKLEIGVTANDWSQAPEDYI